MELVLLECPLVPLSVLEILRALPIEHTVVPTALVLTVASLSKESPPTALHPISELTLVPATVAPPEGPSTIALACLELSLVHVALLASPVVNAPSLLLVKTELAQIVVSSSKVQLSLALKLAIMELTINDLVRVFEKAHALAVGPVYLCLPQVHDLTILKELRIVEGGLHPQHHG